MLFALSDSVLVLCQTAIGAVVTVVLAYMAERTKQAVVEGSRAAAKTADDVQATLKEANDNTDSKLTIIHTLVNRDMHTALSVAAEALNRLAALTKDPADVVKAAAAAEKLAAHDRQQALADHGEVVARENKAKADTGETDKLGL